MAKMPGEDHASASAVASDATAGLQTARAVLAAGAARLRTVGPAAPATASQPLFSPEENAAINVPALCNLNN